MRSCWGETDITRGFIGFNQGASWPDGRAAESFGCGFNGAVAVECCRLGTTDYRAKFFFLRPLFLLTCFGFKLRMAADSGGGSFFQRDSPSPPPWRTVARIILLFLSRDSRSTERFRQRRGLCFIGCRM